MAFGSAGLLAVTGFFVFRRIRSNGQAKTSAGVASSPYPSSGKSLLSGNLYLAERYVKNTPTINPGYRPTEGMQTNRIFGQQLGQSFSTGGWTEGTSVHKNSVSGSYAPQTKFGPLPNMINPTMYSRPQSVQSVLTLNPTSPFQFAGNTQTTQTGGFDRMTTTVNTRFSGNTITVVPKATLQFPTVQTMEN